MSSRTRTTSPGKLRYDTLRLPFMNGTTSLPCSSDTVRLRTSPSCDMAFSQPIGSFETQSPVGTWPHDQSRGILGVALVVLGLPRFVAVAGTHDYRAWNRQRWAALGGLADRGVTAASIGGFGFNATHLSDLDHRGRDSWPGGASTSSRSAQWPATR